MTNFQDLGRQTAESVALNSIRDIFAKLNPDPTLALIAWNNAPKMDDVDIQMLIPIVRDVIQERTREVAMVDIDAYCRCRDGFFASSPTYIPAERSDLGPHTEVVSALVFNIALISRDSCTYPQDPTFGPYSGYRAQFLAAAQEIGIDLEGEQSTEAGLPVINRREAANQRFEPAVCIERFQAAAHNALSQLWRSSMGKLSSQ